MPAIVRTSMSSPADVASQTRLTGPSRRRRCTRVPVAEGVSTTRPIVELARRRDVPMPISQKVDSVLSGVL